MTKINEIDYECLIKNRHSVFGLEEITCVASNLAATLPSLYRMDKRMLSPRIIADCSNGEIIEDLIMHRILFNDWKELNNRMLWQLAFRLQYVYDTLEKMKEMHMELNICGIEAFAAIAVMAAQVYNENAALWLGCATTADEIASHSDDLLKWPQWPKADDERIVKLVQRYTKIIQLSSEY